MKAFLLITTGGTIDKMYDPIEGALVFSGTVIPERLKSLGVDPVWDHRPLMAVDSLDMSESQRDEIAELSQASPHSLVLITHGTDTMVETAERIARSIPRGKTVVLTGAMVPLSVEGSDGEFNLGSSLAYLQKTGEGVYISMQGELFPWNACRKNRELGRFESVR